MNLVYEEVVRRQVRRRVDDLKLIEQRDLSGWEWKAIESIGRNWRRPLPKGTPKLGTSYNRMFGNKGYYYVMNR